MPYFSFSLANNFNAHIFQECKIDYRQIKPNIKYFSKNTALWKMLNHKKHISFLNYIKQEKREKIKKIDKNILICLPPSIGLGDSVEYALSIKAISDNGNFSNIGVAFVGRYKNIFEKYFNINNVYEEVISDNSINKYDTIFHITLEIKGLLFQKYDRQNIEELITNYFDVPKFRTFIKKIVILLIKFLYFQFLLRLSEQCQLI